MKILIVDDDFITSELLKAILNEYGDCTVADNGKNAVAAFQEAINENDPFQLIFLDIMMPEMDGHEALEKIRAIEAEQGVLYGHGTQVVMTTALGDAKNVLSAFSEGCEYYIVKPIEKEKVADVMKQIIK